MQSSKESSFITDHCNLRGIVADERRLKRFYRFMAPEGLVVGGVIAPHWMMDGASFWYVDGAPHDTVILRVDGQTGEVAPLLDVSKTRAALCAVTSRSLSYRGLPFDSVVELGGGRYRFSFQDTDYVLSTDRYVIETVDRQSATAPFTTEVLRAYGADLTDRTVPRPARRVRGFRELALVTETPSPDRRWFASVRDGNIVLRAAVDGRTVALTTDGTPEFTWDIESPRPVFTSGLQLGQSMLDPWSPDGNRLFAIKLDRRAVPDFPLVRYLKGEPEVSLLKMQRAGGPLDIAHPHVIDLRARRTVRLEVGAPEDQYFTPIGWWPDGSEVLFTRHSRDFKTVDVLAGDPASGRVRTVLSESAATFVTLQHDVTYSGNNHVTFVPAIRALIWRSSRTGWNHFYLYGLDGEPMGALTHGEFPVIDVVAVDQPNGWVYFTAHTDQERPYDTHLCRAKLNGQQFERLTALDGENVASVSPAMKTFTVVNSRPDRPYRTDFHACDGRHLAAIQHADVSALAALEHVSSEEFTVLAADGETVLWGVMHKPADFDPNRRYPLIDRLYAGPQVTQAAHNFSLGEHSFPRLDRALAQLGYIVISVDARGTPERSKAFQDVVYRNWGRHEIPDHAAAVRQLAERHPFIDAKRVGVWGHSWGGYFTLRALAQAPEVFHAGVAVAPAANPYDAVLYEPYLDLPARAQAGYDYANLYPWAGRIVGKLMMVIGTCDSFMYSSTLSMAHYLIQAGVDHELVVLPEAYHYFAGKDDEYFVHKLVKHFETHLKPRGAG